MQNGDLSKRAFQWEFATWAVALHLGALLLLPVDFSWSNLALGFALAAITAYSMGIFHHMFLSHGSFKAHPIVSGLGALLGTLTWRGPMASPLRYVALHKVHHAYPNREQDPHSPVHGVFHSLLGWNWNHSPVFAERARYYALARKHATDGWLVFLDRNVHLLQLGLAAVLFTLGGLLGGGSEFDFQGAMGWMVYGVFAKTLFVVYLGNMVDVVNHGVGYRAYETKDRSTNSFAMAFVHLGGAISWHNNHHAHPQFFTVKKNWWEFDVHRLFLRALELLGLVSAIKVLDESRVGEDKKLIHFLTQSRARAALMIAGRLAQVVLSLGISTLVFGSALPFAVKAALGLVFTGLAAIGLHNLALLGHEGTHFNLAKDKMRSSVLGTFFSAMVPFHFNTGFAISHSSHHLHTNTEKDPDVHVFGPIEGWFARITKARRTASLRYFRWTFEAAFDGETRLMLAGLSKAQLRRLARFNLSASLFFTSLVIALMLALGAPFVAAFALSWSGAYLLSSIRPYLEHAGTDTGKFTRARTFSSRLLDFIFGTINYHLAHHLHPRVPAYHLPALHRWLEEQKAFEGVPTVDESGIASLLRAIGRDGYGQARGGTPTPLATRGREISSAGRTA